MVESGVCSWPGRSCESGLSSIGYQSDVKFANCRMLSFKIIAGDGLGCEPLCPRLVERLAARETFVSLDR